MTQLNLLDVKLQNINAVLKIKDVNFIFDYY